MIDQRSIYLSLLSAFILLCVSRDGYGQNGAGSVYSIFGLGELDPSTSVQSRGMGYASIGLSSKYGINLVNPAANDQVGHYFNHITNIGFYYANTEYTTDDASESASYGGLSNLNFWFKISDRWNSMIGLNQYSNVGYNINQKDVNSFQDGEYNVLYQGSGGLNEIFLSNGVSLWENLSVGLKLAFVFGNIDRTEWVTSNQNIQQFYINNTVNIKDVYAEYSLNYRIDRPKYDLNFGLVYKNANTLSGNTLSQITSEAIGETVDLLFEEEEYTQDYALPRKAGFGMSLDMDKFVFAADVEFNQWSEVELEDYSDDLNDTWRYGGGLEFTPDRFGETYMGRVSYRMGGYMENSYLAIDGVTFSKYGFTSGLSLPLRNGSSINIAYERKFNGTLENDLIFEATHEISFNLSIKNKWFQKRKYY
ncbi:hypothetical protein BFP72_00195 [Reichenbachiella sp. 5M10]|uniref:hypothetical protein n=1 Tax=Reichenbachiella sp. 5M10 TaxID=1889772 RepID=UPI000C1510BD|nr:hypothetical protein [Reichenbachiella sp. 5M10]PIB33963.1 hypothetical protein BFP72_00195 [Reichenbachiella sp. 5M10]